MISVQNIFNTVISQFQAQAASGPLLDSFSRHMTLFLSSASLVVLLLVQKLLLFSNLHNCMILLLLIPQGLAFYSAKNDETFRGIKLLILGWHLTLLILSFHSIQLKILSILYLSTLIYKIHIITTSVYINALNYSLCALQLLVQKLFNNFDDIEFYEYISIDLVSIYVLTESLLICGYRYFTRPSAPEEKKKPEHKEQVVQDLMKITDMRLMLIRIFVLGIRDFIQQLDEIINNESERGPEISTQKLKPLRYGTQNSIILLKNVIDLAKRASEGIESNLKVVDPVDFMHKVLNYNQDVMKTQDIHPQIFISKSMPSYLRIDIPKFLQIITTLLLLSVKNSKKKGKILLFTAWADPSERRTLLSPFEESSILRDTRNFEESHSPASPGEFRANDRIRESLRLSECDVGFLQPDSHHIESLDSKKMKSIFDVNEFNKLIMKRFRLLEQTIYSPAQENRSFTSGFLKFELSDNGQPIPQEELSKILLQNPGPYDDGQASRSGYILWAAKNLCQIMGGDIAVYSKPGQGNTIVFYFPAESNSFKLARLIPERKIYRALIVDPDNFTANAHKKLLEKEGIKALITSNGNEALEKIIGQSGEAFDLGIIDCELKDTNVIALAKEIRKNEQVYRKNIFMDLVFLRGTDNELNPQLVMEFKNIEGHNVIYKRPLDKNMISVILARLTNKSSDSSPNSKTDSNKADMPFGVRNRVNQVQHALRKAI